MKIALVIEDNYSELVSSPTHLTSKIITVAKIVFTTTIIIVTANPNILPYYSSASYSSQIAFPRFYCSGDYYDFLTTL